MTTRAIPIRLLVFLAAFTIGTTSACSREERSFRPSADAAAIARGPRANPNHAGPSPESLAATSVTFEGSYDPTAYDLSQGKILYQNMNCTGCHGAGGGGMGPPLMDDAWIYGAEPRDIYTSIVTGRPNGMPSFEGRLPAYQVWQLVAYAQAMSGQTPIDASPGRSDHMRPHRPEIITEYQGRIQTGHK